MDRARISVLVPPLILVAAALIEVGGDAIIRQGLRDRRWLVVLAGCLTLAAYGLVLNLLRWDFSKLLGTYVALFAVASVLIARFAFAESIPRTTWLGLALIVLGAALIQAGNR